MGIRISSCLSFISGLSLLLYIWHLLSSRPKMSDDLNGYVHAFEVKGVIYFLTSNDLIVLFICLGSLVVSVALTQVLLFQRMKKS